MKGSGTGILLLNLPTVFEKAFYINALNLFLGSSLYPSFVSTGELDLV